MAIKDYKSETTKSSKTVRLNKHLADRGVASRRKADELIAEGSVMINGKKVYELGIQVDPQNDRITVNGKPLKSTPYKIYIMLNKPTGVLTTMEDPLGRPTVKDLITKIPYRVFPVGRLDWDSEGLLLLTNDGDWAQQITHPKSEATKTYLVKINGVLKAEQTQKLLNGVTIEDGKVAAKHIEKIKRGKDQYGWYKMIITEGKNRQIRKMFEKIGFDVLKLQRVAIGRLRLGSTPRGSFVILNEVAAQRALLADDPVKVSENKSYKGRNSDTNTSKKSSPRGGSGSSSKRFAGPRDRKANTRTSR